MRTPPRDAWVLKSSYCSACQAGTRAWGYACQRGCLSLICTKALSKLEAALHSVTSRSKHCWTQLQRPEQDPTGNGQTGVHHSWLRKVRDFLAKIRFSQPQNKLNQGSQVPGRLQPVPSASFIPSPPGHWTLGGNSKEVTDRHAPGGRGAGQGA